MDGLSLNICLFSIDVDDPFGSGRLFKEKCWDPILLILGTQNNRAWDELANDIKAGGNNNAIVISTTTRRQICKLRKQGHLQYILRT